MLRTSVFSWHEFVLLKYFQVPYTQNNCTSMISITSYSNLEEDPRSSLMEGLWRQATTTGAFTPMEKGAFRLADDM